MNAPVGLLGAALLFWGQQTGYWALGAALGLGLECSRLLSRRWELTPEDFHRVGDLCTLLFAGLVVYLYLTRELIQLLATVLALQPVFCFPLIAAQALSTQQSLDLGALFWSLRRRIPGVAVQAIDVSFPYFVLCVLSAGSAAVRTPVFYEGLFALSAWALWRFRSLARPRWLWAALLACAGVLGYLGAFTWVGLQSSLERAAVNAFSGGDDVSVDPEESSTAIGRIGRIQQSGEIALRVSTEGKPPALLRGASYNHYRNSQWFAWDSGFSPLASVPDAAGWSLAAAAPGSQSVVVTEAWRKGEGVLTLPLDAFRVEGLSGAELSRNALGAVKAANVPAVVSYRVVYAPGAQRDAPPVAADLELPAPEKDTFTDLARQLQLAGRPPREAVAQVARFFSEDFRYTVYQAIAGPAPLKQFLSSRAGHCEYFATATVLLLRAGGIPARYAAGYAVEDYSRLERAYIVRQRDAHAWALAYVDGAWRDVDTTPGAWPEIERRRSSPWEPLSDLASWAKLRLAEGRLWLSGAGGHGPLAWLLLSVLVLWFFWKAAAFRKTARGATPGTPAAARALGEDSEFYAVEEQLIRSGFERRRWEAPAAWIERIAPELGSNKTSALRALVLLHYRYRFDPQGITPEQRRALAAGVQEWLSAQVSLAMRQ